MTVALRTDQSEITPELRSGGHLQLHAEQSTWTPDQRAALNQLGLAEASEADLKVFLHQAQRTGLDPFIRQIYMIGRYDYQSKGTKYTIQTGIDGFRLIASWNSHYAGQSEPEWCGDDGVWRDAWLSRKPPAAARVKVMRRDWDLPAVGVAMFHEYAQTKKDGGLTQMWGTKPAHMLAKCAEALALRKAFPHDLSGIYTEEELGTPERRPGRVTITQDQDAPVTGDELRGIAPAPASTPEPDATTASESPGDRMSQPQQRKLFALIREHNIENRNDWASGILVRDITSFGQLTQGDAARLIDDLEAPVTGEVVDDEAAWAADVSEQ